MAGEGGMKGERKSLHYYIVAPLASSKNTTNCAVSLG